MKWGFLFYFQSQSIIGFFQKIAPVWQINPTENDFITI